MMDDRIRDLEFLLPDFPEPELRALSAVLLERSFQDGECVCRQHDPGHSAFLLASGNVDVRIGMARSRVAVLRPGQMFGQMSLVDGQPRSATCRAVGTTKVYELTSDALVGLARSSATLAARLLWRVAKQLAVNLRNADVLLARLAEANPWLDLSARGVRDMPSPGSRAPAHPAAPEPKAPPPPPPMPAAAPASSFRQQLENVARNLSDVDLGRVRLSQHRQLTGATIRDPLRRWGR